MGRDKKMIAIVLIAVAVAVIAAGILVGTREDSTGPVASSAQSTNTTLPATPYRNPTYGYSLSLPVGWQATQQTTYVNGVATMSDSSVQFQSANGQYRIVITVTGGVAPDTTAAQYAASILTENRRQFEEKETPYQWQFTTQGSVIIAGHDAYQFTKLRGPNGVENVLYLVSVPYAYQISYYERTSEGIATVTVGVSDAVMEVLDTLTISKNNVQAVSTP